MRTHAHSLKGMTCENLALSLFSLEPGEGQEPLSDLFSEKGQISVNGL